MSLLPCLGAVAKLAAKGSGEAAAALVAYRSRHLLNGHVCLLEQPLGLLEPLLAQVAEGGGGKHLAKALLEFVVV